jgi:hypothetical protein
MIILAVNGRRILTRFCTESASNHDQAIIGVFQLGSNACNANGWSRLDAAPRSTFNAGSQILAEYRTTAGRSRVIERVTAGVTPCIGERFNNALGLLTYWRDEAGHGTPSNIGEVEAHEAILGLLRLARLMSDNWATLTA